MLNIEQASHVEVSFDDDYVEAWMPDEIPPFQRKPESGTVQAGVFWLAFIDAKLHKLEALGLRPQQYLLDNRAVMERWARGEGAGESMPPPMQRQGWF